VAFGGKERRWNCADGRQNSGEVNARPQVKLLEYDERFAVFKEFVRYDFEKAIQLPAELKGSFDAIICDPPFLSQDCQTKGEFIVTESKHLDMEITHNVQPL
jgi:tRNA1(Val) A37 N6-methylase TrmN6